MALVDLSYVTARLAGVTQDCLDAASDCIERYCNRTFAVTSYDELYDGTGYLNLILNNYPIQSITRVGILPIQVIQISNTTRDAARALIRLDDTNIYLDTSIDGVEHIITLPRSSYLTLADLATGVNTYSAYGWKAQALGNYSTWAVADLYSPQGGFDARMGTAYFKMHQWNLFDYEYRAETGEVVCYFGFTRGYRNVRVIYSAGFPDIPTPIQNACAELAIAIYQFRNVNANMQQEQLGSGVAYTNIGDKLIGSLSLASKMALSQYTNRRLPRFKVM